MRLILNLLWLVFGGFWLFLGYVFAGLLLCLPIITIPWALASFRIATYALWPFGLVKAAVAAMNGEDPSRVHRHRLLLV